MNVEGVKFLIYYRYISFLPVCILCLPDIRTFRRTKKQHYWFVTRYAKATGHENNMSSVVVNINMYTHSRKDPSIWNKEGGDCRALIQKYPMNRWKSIDVTFKSIYTFILQLIRQKYLTTIIVSIMQQIFLKDTQETS